MKLLSFITVLLLVFFAMFPHIDMQVSSFFFDKNSAGFTYRESLPSMIIYYSVRLITISVFLLCAFIITYDSGYFKAIYSRILPKLTSKIRSFLKFNNKQAVFLLLIILITPGILVHWVMKPVWDRARPVNVQEFGGEMKFTNFYSFRAGQDGNSFPSGHASMAFSLLAFIYIVRKERRKKVLAAALAYAIIASLCRIWQGGHYLTDVVFSALLTLWTIFLVNKFYLEKHSKKEKD